jgi:hypothetical protein
MTAAQIFVWTLAVTFAVSVVMLIAVVLLKVVHRKRSAAHALRRSSFLATLGRHLANPGSAGQLTTAEATDEAFIDAVIDLRNTAIGSDVEALDGLIDREQMIRAMGAKLAAPFPLGRRLRAVVALAEIGDRGAAPILVRHLSDRDPAVRTQSARGLARMNHVPAIHLILERLADEPAPVRNKLVGVLALFGRHGIWHIVAYIRDHHDAEKNQAVPGLIRVLGQVGDFEIGKALSGLLDEATDIEVILAIIETLGVVGGPDALKPIRRMMRSEDWRIRAKAVSSLGTVGEPSSIPMIALSLGDPAWWVRRNAASALGGLPGGIDWLYNALRSSDRFTGDAAAEVLADVGELAKARTRLDEGAPEERDLLLIRYMDEPEMVEV